MRHFSFGAPSTYSVAVLGIPPHATLMIDDSPRAPRHAIRIHELTYDELDELHSVVKDAMLAVESLPVGKLDRMTSVRRHGRHTPMDRVSLMLARRWPYDDGFVLPREPANTPADEHDVRNQPLSVFDTYDQMDIPF